MRKTAKMLEFSELARRDLDDAWGYLAEVAPEAADSLIDELFGVCKLIAANPLVGRVRPELMIGLRYFPHKNYNIFYLPTDEGVEICRVLHASRDHVQLFDKAIDGNI